MTDQDQALAALRAADPASSVAVAPWRGSTIEAEALRRVDAVDVYDIAQVRQERRARPWLLTAVAAVAAVILTVTIVVVNGIRGSAPAARQPVDPQEVSARAWVHAHRNAFALPPGTTRLDNPPAGLASEHLFPQHDPLVSSTSYWRVDAPMPEVARWIRAHKPAGFTSGGTGTGRTDGVLTDQDERFDAGRIRSGKQRVVWLAYQPYEGGTAIRVTVWADWSRS